MEVLPSSWGFVWLVWGLLSYTALNNLRLSRTIKIFCDDLICGHNISKTKIRFCHLIFTSSRFALKDHDVVRKDAKILLDLTK